MNACIICLDVCAHSSGESTLLWDAVGCARCEDLHFVKIGCLQLSFSKSTEKRDSRTRDLVLSDDLDQHCNSDIG